MPRRRYRLFFFCAIVIVFMLYRVGRNSEWDPTSYTSVKPHNSNFNSHTEHDHSKGAPGAGDKSQLKHGKLVHGDGDSTAEKSPKKAQTVEIPDLKTSLEGPGKFGLPAATPAKANRVGHPDTRPEPTAVPPWPGMTENDNPEEELHWKQPPGNLRGGAAAQTATSTVSKEHWEKIPEKFPIPEESLITLPTGTPKDIPTIQFKFGEESESSKAKRVKRLAEIKSEMKRAWSGYRKYAWMHDELSPVSSRNRDPFCGWAASLVDGLDTLWIMGLKEEFDEAAKAVKDIDFTYTFRNDIPVFETIIRYLGGLLAAYDMSGGHEGDYHMLLEKAIELAEILMGVFDTPNRLPILYYYWRPSYASQPHRAGIVSVAELGSMSMEFTRLAQLTGKQKYYDAIARITNAFEDLQNRGTSLNGIFPEQLDASGCNKTAAANSLSSSSENAQSQMNSWMENPQGYQPADETSEKLARGETTTVAGAEETKQPVAGTASHDDVDLPRGNGSEPRSIPELGGGARRRAVRFQEEPRGAPPPIDFSATNDGPYAANGNPANWDCVPQGLVPGGYGYEVYSMGGSQDSTYEYFPKVGIAVEIT
jgi:mannosyl-oligosaccharide alpha-1,2-mannosidase